MNLPLDQPLEFDITFCRICKGTDANWQIFHLLNDGFWRSLEVGKTLRELGISGEEKSLFLVHSCCENLLQNFHTCEEVEEFFMQMRE